MGAHREETSLGVERKFGNAGQVAAVGIEEEGFAALAAPFDRAADPARRPHHQGIFAIEQVLGAEAAADVAADHAHLVFVDAEHAAQRTLLDQDALPAGA